MTGAFHESILLFWGLVSSCANELAWLDETNRLPRVLVTVWNARDHHLNRKLDASVCHLMQRSFILRYVVYLFEMLIYGLHILFNIWPLLFHIVACITSHLLSLILVTFLIDCIDWAGYFSGFLFCHLHRWNGANLLWRCDVLVDIRRILILYHSSSPVYHSRVICQFQYGEGLIHLVLPYCQNK